jgi:gliding motility-associated-like protein
MKQSLHLFSFKKLLSGFISLTLVLSFGISAKAQLTVSNAAPYNSVSYLVKSILLGNGVSVSNITYKGDDTAVGFFNGIKSSIGLDSGVLMTSGTITNAPGPNNTASASYAGPNCASNTDSDLALLTGSPMDDACIIEFDFIPYSDTVKFQYVFGSEEYPEFVGSYNDGFGFFISGPGISGPYSHNAENIALIPHTTTPVTINNVNCSTNYAYYVCNWPSKTCLSACPTSSSMPSTTVQYDGYTVPLTAVAAVQCGQQYHIKLAVADAVDCVYDSGVFLKSGSFSTTGTSVTDAISYMSSPYPNDTILYRGSCGKASIYFERGATNSVDTIVVDTGGTAIGGIDYNTFKDTIILGIGVSGDTLNISGLPSTNNDTVTLTLTVTQRICNTIDTAKLTIYISNPPKIVATSPIYKACMNGSASITSVVTGGIGSPYTYLWSNGSTSSSITVNNITSDTTFLVHVKDVCGDSALDSIHVNLASKIPLKAITKDTTVNCPVGTVPISVLPSGGSPSYTYSWNTGATSSSINVSPTTTTVYTVTVKDSCGNSFVDSVKVNVKDMPLVVTSHDTSIYCAGLVNLSANASGGGGGYSYSWSNGATSSSISVNATKDTNYICTVTSPCGGQVVKDTVKVTVLPSPFKVTINANPDSVCLGQNVTLSATGGGTYSWSTGATTSSVTVTPASNTTYTLSVVNGNCVNDTNVNVFIVAPPTIKITPNQKVCQGESSTITATVTGAKSYVWSNGATTSSITVTPGSTTTYVVTATDGCVTKDSATVTVVLPSLSACCDTTIITGDTVTISAYGGSSYVWTPNTSLSCSTCPNPIASPTVTTTYTVVSTDSNNCHATREVTVFVECLDFTVPNVFTPNNDGRNDDFVPYYTTGGIVHNGVGNMSSYSIQIYDRWGKQVYNSNDPTKYWNGTLNNTQYLVPDGVYYYIIKATCGSNNYDHKGFVQVLGGGAK